MRYMGPMATALLMLAACGGDDDDSKAFSTSLDTSRQASSLSAEEYQTFCQETSEFADRTTNTEETVRGACVAFVVAFADDFDENRCREVAEQCVQTTDKYQEPSVDCSDSEVKERFLACDATLQQIVTCYNDVTGSGSAVQRISEFTCENPPSKEEVEQVVGDDQPMPPSCGAVSECLLFDSEVEEEDEVDGDAFMETPSGP